MLIINHSKFYKKRRVEFMKSQMKMLDDLAQLAGGAVGLMNSIQKQIKNDIREKVDETLHNMDLVARSDFDRVEAMLSEARQKQEELEKRLEALETSGKTKKAKTSKASSKKK